MKQINHRKWFAGVVALVVALSCTAPVWAEESEEERTIRISSAQELRQLAKDCVLDTYSKGLTVQLTADIALNGEDFTPIPVFCGTFDGGGHTISGFTINNKGSDQGFFRYVQEGAVVRHLKLDAKVQPDGSKSGVGGIAGKNEGRILNCTMAGTVSGDADVGGLVGVNGETGVLEGCVSHALIEGNTRTGGIAGHNLGQVKNCSNNGSVNIEANEKASDTGGIAGRSEGTLESCYNYGNIGYPHTGYNTGGIAGLQNGSILHCRNHGGVEGRKDVGGIIGQFEPDITLHYGEDPIEALDESLAEVTSMLTQLSTQLADTVDGAASGISAINDAMASINDRVGTGADEGREDASAALDEINAAAQMMEDAVSQLLDGVDTFTADANQDLEQLDKAIKAFRGAVGDAADGVDDGVGGISDAFETGLTGLSDTLQGVRNEIAGMSGDLETIQNFAKAVIDIAASDATDKLEQIKDAAKALEDVDLSGSIERIGNLLASAGDDLKTLRDDISSAYEKASKTVQDALDDAGSAAGRMETALKSLRDHFGALSDNFTGQMRVLNTQTGIVEDTLYRYFNLFGDKGDALLSDVGDQLDIINGEIHSLSEGAGKSGNDISGTFNSLVIKMDEVRRILTDAAKGPVKTVDDVSGDEEEETGKGRVVSCTNHGAVRADANVGGVAGIVAPELNLDPEEDLDWNGLNLLADKTTTVRATLRECRNEGSVTAKNECAGGVLGRGDVGAAVSCQNIGPVEVSEGDYCGGIAGRSKTIIRESYVLAALTGGSYVGGIAGEGSDIQDCRVMVSIESDGERLGAVAGMAAGEVAGNLFVEEGLAGIDGVNYAGKAVSISYDDFSALEELPADFLTFTVTFVVDGKKAQDITVEYGGRVSDAQIPEVPEKDGAYGEWETFEKEDIRRSQVVNAVYTGYAKTVSTTGRQPALLAEGAFGPDAALTAEPWNPDAAMVPEGFAAAAGYTVKLENPGAEASGPYTLRIRSEDENARVAVLKDGALVQVEAVQDGSYLVFSAELPAKVCLLVRPGQLVLWIILGGAGLLLVMIGLAVCLLRRKKKGGRPIPSLENESTGEENGNSETAENETDQSQV